MGGGRRVAGATAGQPAACRTIAGGAARLASLAAAAQPITQRNHLLTGLQEADALVGAASTPSIGNSVMGMLKRVTCQVGGGALHTWLSLPCQPLVLHGLLLASTTRNRS